MAYRVIQWATGAMGKTCLRAVIDHPDLELVGVYVYSAAKEGRDAGEIARRGLTGVRATRSIAEVLARDADVVIHAPRIRFPYDAHKADICRLLASGKNVISINGHSYPAYQFAELVCHLAHRLGVDLERIEPDHEVVTAPTDIQAAAGVVPAGTVAATNWRWHAIVGGKPLITLSVNWIMDEKLPGYENSHHWTVELRGKPGLDISMDLVEPEEPGTRTRAVQYGVAGSVINSIPEVCAAAPGILDFPLFAPYRRRFPPAAPAERAAKE